MKSASLFLAGFLFFTMFASPADAKRFRFFFPGFSGGDETIDLVYTLPKQPPFVRDGKAFDVGYLNSRKGNAYVLYHGNSYIKLGEREIAALRAVLGFDPTAQHRAQHAGAPAPEQAQATGANALEASADETVRDVLSDRTPIWIVMIPLIFIAAILLVFVLRGSRGLSKFAGPLTRLVSGKEDTTQTAYAALDARMTERLNKMQPDTAPSAYPSRGTGHFSPAPSSAAHAPVRTFGRRNA